MTFAEGICVKVRRRKNTKSGEQSEIMSFAGGICVKATSVKNKIFQKNTPAEKGSHENYAFRRGNMCKSAHGAPHVVDGKFRKKYIAKQMQKRAHL